MAIQGPVTPNGYLSVWLVDGTTVYWTDSGNTISNPTPVRRELINYRDAGMPTPSAPTVTLINTMLAIAAGSWQRGEPPALSPPSPPSLRPPDPTIVTPADWVDITVCDDGTVASDICPEPPWPHDFETINCEDNCP